MSRARTLAKPLKRPPLSEGETLARWREATGRTTPGDPVAVGARVEVGAFTFATTADRLPAKLVGDVLGTRKPPKPKRPPAAARLVALPRARVDDGPSRTRLETAEEAQRRAWREALDAGEWAPVPAPVVSINAPARAARLLAEHRARNTPRVAVA